MELRLRFGVEHNGILGRSSKSLSGELEALLGCDNRVQPSWSSADLTGEPLLDRLLLVFDLELDLLILVRPGRLIACLIGAKRFLQVQRAMLFLFVHRNDNNICV